MTKYNWDIIKDQFIYGIRREDGTKHYPTIDDIVKMNSRGTLFKRKLGRRKKKAKRADRS